MPWNTPYTLYIGNKITKIRSFIVKICQNNSYYRFGSYILNISSKFFEFLRTNTFCNVNTRNIRESGRQATYYSKHNRIMMLIMLFNCCSNINTFFASSIIICTNCTLFLAFFPIFRLHFSGFFDLFLLTLGFVSWDIFTTTVINF